MRTIAIGDVVEVLCMTCAKWCVREIPVCSLVLGASPALTETAYGMELSVIARMTARMVQMRRAARRVTDLNSDVGTDSVWTLIT